MAKMKLKYKSVRFEKTKANTYNCIRNPIGRNFIGKGLIIAEIINKEECWPRSGTAVLFDDQLTDIVAFMEQLKKDK